MDDYSKFNASLAYVHYDNPDTSYIKLIINKELTNIIIPIPKKELRKRKWDKILIDCDLDTKVITISLNDRQSSINYNLLPNKFNLKIFFGIGEHYQEVPRMAIRNIRIFKTDLLNGKFKLAHHWALDEFEGKIAKDKVGGLAGEQRNGEWLANAHTDWQLQKTIFIQPGTGVTLDTLKRKILFVEPDRIRKYDWIINTIDDEKFNAPHPNRQMTFVYNHFTNKLLAFHGGRGEVTVYDEEKKVWFSIDSSNDSLQHYYGSSIFINPLNGDLMMFCGYGWYLMKNHLQKYNFTEAVWETLKVKGDTPEPRFGTSLYYTNNPEEVLIFGGLGNKTGRQDEKYEIFYDLWELNLKTYTFKKIWVNKGLTNIYRRGGGSNLYPFPEKNIYYMFTPTNLEWDSFQFCELNTEKATLRPVSEVLFSVSRDAPVLFFYDKYSNEFVAVTQQIDYKVNLWEARIYTLAYPPIRAGDLKTIGDEKTSVIYLFIGFGFLFITVITFATYKFIKFKKSRKEHLPDLPIEQYAIPKNLESVPQYPIININHLQSSEEKKSAINVFGGLEVFDTEGRNITKEFSPKIRQLFGIILLHTNGTKINRRGISTEKLTDALWPEADPLSAKNSRGVAISNLRNILAKVGNIKVVNDQSLWLIEADEEIFCEYFLFNEIRINLLKGNEEILPGTYVSFVEIVKKGLILPEISTDWIEPIRKSLSDDITMICLKYAEKFNNPEYWETHLNAAESILMRDSLNEDGLRLKLTTLMNLGRHGVAKDTYDTFCIEFKNIFDEEYRVPFKDLISKP